MHSSATPYQYSSPGDVSSLVSAAVSAVQGGAIQDAMRQVWSNLLLELAGVGCTAAQLGPVPSAAAVATAVALQRLPGAGPRGQGSWHHGALLGTTVVLHCHALRCVMLQWPCQLLCAVLPWPRRLAGCPPAALGAEMRMQAPLDKFHSRER